MTWLWRYLRYRQILRRLASEREAAGWDISPREWDEFREQARKQAGL
jgi:hypothetical protein